MNSIAKGGPFWSNLLRDIQPGEIFNMASEPIGEAKNVMIVGLGQALLIIEWVVTRLGLYAMIFLGAMGSYDAGYRAEPLAMEMGHLRGHLSWMIGIAALAIVSRLPRKELK